MANNPLPFHPKIGEVLRCDYSNLVMPEMSKVRWVVVISPKFLNRPNLCTVIPLSTTPPKNVEPYHVKLDKDPYPKGKIGAEIWAKCDMLMTVSFYRLTGYWDGKVDGKRNYVSIYVSDDELKRIKKGTLAALGMSHLHK